MDTSTKQKISKETQALSDTMEQVDQIDIYRTYHAKTMNLIFFSSAYGAFSRTDYILSHKPRLGKFKKKLKSLQAIFFFFFNHKVARLHVNYRKKTINVWRLNKTLLSNQ